jgi:hypothetical protein
MFEEGDILVIHLVNGQDVVAKLKSSEADGLLIETPTYLMMKQGKNPGDVAVGFSHYLTHGDIFPQVGTMLMPYHAIILPRVAPQNIAQGYVRATTGIQIAKTVPSVLQRV